jgi:hypothetical protein
VKRGRSRATPVPGGAQLFHRIYTRLGCEGRPPHFLVEFFPYANLMHTIRLREGVAHVRLSDLLRAAPMALQEAAAAILLAQLYRRRVPRELQEEYKKFTLATRTRRRIDRIRRVRGRKITSGPQGAAHDLAPMFVRLNAEYFDGVLRCPRLGWSRREWRRQLGCFDPGVDQIVMNVRLDRETVPPFVVEYILYHEVLHVKHPIRAAACGLQSHSKEFRAEERRFRDYERARQFLKRMR